MYKRSLSIALTLIMIMTIFMGVPVFAAGSVTLDKTEFTAYEKGYATIKGLTDQQIEDGAWLAISPEGERVSNTEFDQYVSELSADNIWEFEAPLELGKYEIRLMDADHNLLAKAAFSVGAPKAKPGDIVISKSEVKIKEPMSVKIGGLTDELLEAGAWFGTVQFTVSGEAATSDDIAAGEEGLSTWAAPVVNEAKDENLVTDKIMVDFPAPITREEFCELAVLLYEKMTGIKAALPVENPFSDTTNPEILKAVNLGVTGGIGGGKFGPNNNITRQELSVMLLRALKAVMPNIPTTAEFKTQFQDVAAIDAWALESVRFMNANDILTGSTVNGVSYILPKGNTTREQAIAMVLRLYNKFNQL